MWEMLGALLVGSVVSGIVPVVNAELLVVVTAAALPPLGVPFVAIASTVGQMVSKTSLFGVAKWAPSKLPAKARAGLLGASQRMASRGGAAGSLIFASAVTGLPPFYGTSLAAGALGVRTSRFVACGAAGRLIRFGALAWAGSHFGEAALEVVRGAAPVALGG